MTEQDIENIAKKAASEPIFSLDYILMKRNRKFPANPPRLVIDEKPMSIEFMEDYRIKHIIHYSTKHCRSYVTDVNRNDGTQTFSHWKPMAFDEFIKYIYNINIKY